MKTKTVTIIIFYTLFSLITLTSCSDNNIKVHMANGIKIGEVTNNSTIIWTRLTKESERNIHGKPFAKSEKPHINPEFGKLEEMEGVVLGIDGEVRIIYAPENGTGRQLTSEWKAVLAEMDFTAQFQLSDLL